MKNVVIEEFSSLGQYIDVIGKRKINKVFSRKSLSSEMRDYDFTLTHDYEESVKIATEGYKEGLDELSVVDTKFQYKEKISKKIPSVDFVGYAPHVANAIAGVPKSMISATNIEQKAKVITILYSNGDNGGANTSNYITAGKNILNVINTLELQGYRVAVIVIHCSFEDNQFAVRQVMVKHWRQPSNPLKLAYPLLHPSFQRRQGFKWLETHPDIEDSCFSRNYGHTFNTESMSEQKEKLREIGVLKQSYFYTNLIEAKDNEADKLIKLMGVR